MTLASIFFTIAYVLFDIAMAIAIVFIICKLVAKIKASKAAKKANTTTVDIEDDDDTPEDTDTDENGEGTPETSEEVKPCDPCPEKGAKKTADEALDVAEKANKKSTEALEANQATDKKVEEDKAAKAEEQRQAFIAKNAEKIDLNVLLFSKAYSDYATAVLRRNTKAYAGKELAENADEASKKLCVSESAQICRDTDYGYAGELKRTGYQNIGARQRRGEEVVPEEQSGLDEIELKAFCDADNANADFEAAKAEAEAANKAVVSNNDEVSNFKGVADSAVTAMKDAYAVLKACKLNDDEIATKVNLEVAMLKAIVA